MRCLGLKAYIGLRGLGLKVQGFRVAVEQRGGVSF